MFRNCVTLNKLGPQGSLSFSEAHRHSIINTPKAFIDFLFHAVCISAHQTRKYFHGEQLQENQHSYSPWKHQGHGSAILLSTTLLQREKSAFATFSMRPSHYWADTIGCSISASHHSDHHVLNSGSGICTIWRHRKKSALLGQWSSNKVRHQMEWGAEVTESLLNANTYEILHPQVTYIILIFSFLNLNEIVDDYY